MLTLFKVSGKVVIRFHNGKGKVLYTFVHLISLTYSERLCIVGCGLKGKLALLLSQGVVNQFEPSRNWRACNNMMLSIIRRVAAGLAAAVRDKTAKEAEELCTLGQCAAALVPLQRAIDMGHLPSRALKAWLLLDGREGVAQDRNRAFELVEEGTRSGCHHCQGVLAECYLWGYGCEQDEERSLELARESSGKGSRYGQHVLGLFYRWGGGGVAEDYAQALALYRLAAAQNFGGAQFSLGSMYYLGRGVAEDVAEALRLFQLAAAQGHPHALFWVAFCHERGRGIPENKAEAIRWYRRALAAGYWGAAAELHRLCV
jgi:TPR repeat protein